MHLRALCWVGLLLVGVGTRLPYVAADLPFDVEGTNAPNLDAYWYLTSALATVEGASYISSPAHDRPLHNLLAITVLGVGGVSRATVNLVSILPGLAAVVLTFEVVRRCRALGEALLAAGFLALSFPYAMLNRSPLIYSGLSACLVLGLALRLLPARRVGIPLAWGIGLLAVFAYKILAVAFLGGLLLAGLVTNSTRGRWPVARASAALSGLLLCVAGLIMLFPDVVGWNTERVQRYLIADLGPLGCLKSALNLSLSTGFGVLSPVLVLLGMASLPLALHDRSLEGRGRTLLLICAGWALTFLVAATFLQPRPLRYATILFPPLAILAGYSLWRCLTWRSEGSERGIEPAKLAATAIVAFWAGYTSLGLLGQFLLELVPQPPAWLMVSLSFEGLTCGAGVSAILGAGLSAGRLRPPTRLVRGVGVTALVAFLLLNGGRVLRHYAGPPASSLVEASAALEHVLARRALLVGPYAAALGTDSVVQWQHVWFQGMDPTFAARCRELGATHVAIDPTQSGGGSFERWFRERGVPLEPVTTLVLRGQPVRVLRFAWASEVGYEPSPFERARGVERTHGPALAHAAWVEECARDRAAPLLLGVARTALAAEEWQVALRASAEAMERWPSSARCWRVRALALSAAGRPEAAKGAAERASALEPTMWMLKETHSLREESEGS